MVMEDGMAVTLDHKAKTVRVTKGKHCPTIRNTLTSPYSCKWPELQSGVTPKILEEIKRTFQPLQCSLAKRKSKNKKWSERRKLEQAEEDAEQERQKKALRWHLALGVNEVTRGLERGELRLVMVCRTSKPDIMTSHLCPLSATRGCPAVAVFHLSTTLAPLLNMKTVLAIGFKKPTDGSSATAFDEFVAEVTKLCPPISVPWLERRGIPPKDLAQILSRTTFRGHSKLQPDLRTGGRTATGDREQAKALPALADITADAAGPDPRRLEQQAAGIAVGDADETGNRLSVLSEGNLDGGSPEEREGRIPKKIVSGHEEIAGLKEASEYAETRSISESCLTLSSDGGLSERGSRSDTNIYSALDPDKEKGTARGEDPRASKKRKLDSVAKSPDLETGNKKRQKIVKMPYAPTSIKSIKIISKELKGKKKRKGKKK